MCEVSSKVHCPHCFSDKVVKNGKKPTGVQNLLCRRCGKQFQDQYLYQGADPACQRQALHMLRRGSSLSDCADVLAVSGKTVARCLRRQAGKLVVYPLKKQYAGSSSTNFGRSSVSGKRTNAVVFMPMLQRPMKSWPMSGASATRRRPGGSIA